MATWSMRPWKGANRSLRAPTKTWPPLSGNVGVCRPSISGSAAPFKYTRTWSPCRTKHHVIPGVQRQQRRAREEFVSPVAVEDDQTAGGDISPPDAQVLAWRVGGIILAAREEISCDGPGVDGQFVPDPHLGGVVPRQSGQDGFQSPAGEVRRGSVRATNLRAVLQHRGVPVIAGVGHAALVGFVQGPPRQRLALADGCRVAFQIGRSAGPDRLDRGGFRRWQRPGRSQPGSPVMRGDLVRTSRPACTRRCRPACLPACCRGRGGPRRTSAAPAAT